jgi:hypothetical protein
MLTLIERYPTYRKYSTYASDLGWPPGVWPSTATIDGGEWTRRQFVYNCGNDDVAHVIYKRHRNDGLVDEVLVFND